MRTGIILLNFGEPEEVTLEAVSAYLERIFMANASLERHGTIEAARARSRQLAADRAPGLIEEYQAIGGSPLNQQAREQAELLLAELTRRDHDVRIYVGHQYAEPLIAEAVREARADGVDRLIGLPVYPLAGPTTTILALEMLARELETQGWDVPLEQIGGWHRHPHFTTIWADEVRATLREAGCELADPGVELVFSVHGTPLKYIEEGSRYMEYAEEACAAVAAELGTEHYRIGYQNHTNRPLAWTQPDIDEVVRGLDAESAIVVPIAFMREQSETLAELDDELREIAEGAGLGFHRVAVPYRDPRLIELLADLVEPLLADVVARGGTDPATRVGYAGLRPCTCKPGASCMGGAAATTGTTTEVQA
jgi:ferrochelatase